MINKLPVVSWNHMALERYTLTLRSSTPAFLKDKTEQNYSTYTQSHTAVQTQCIAMYSLKPTLVLMQCIIRFNLKIVMNDLSAPHNVKISL